MKLVILAGGYGTRLSEETKIKPKPMVEIGGQPIIWHIMKYYSQYGIREFIIALGYKGNVIKKYFNDLLNYEDDLQIDFRTGLLSKISSKHKDKINWKVKLIYTGKDTLTGGRLKRLKNHIKDKNFMLTYGDGLSNVDLKSLLNFHKSSKKILTLTAVKSFDRFGSIKLDKNNQIKSFNEKEQKIINGGFFVCSNKIFDHIDNDNSILEKDVMNKLLKINQISAYMHKGFWQCMDNQYEKNYLNELWLKNPPWKIW